ncbi:uncharacterized protein N0V96_006853 [Colletotrichum fioriniae]|uniref:uncharacterized protein n=1 Tax=Colletotrichum fioriniae TaxID=710243 RepID=UPI0032D9E21A|nr:hypothetical protein N0V96_006853 [Colletotrichum fioriniae]
MPSADAQKGHLQTVLENKGIRFQFKTGSAKYDERTKATRTNSTDSQTSSSSASTVSSSH